MQAANAAAASEQGAARGSEALNASLMAEVAELRLGNAALWEARTATQRGTPPGGGAAEQAAGADALCPAEQNQRRVYLSIHLVSFS